jgi:hypothetical protein
MGSDSNVATDVGGALRDALRALWDRFRPVIEQRIAVLEQAADATRLAELATALRSEFHRGPD